MMQEIDIGELSSEVGISTAAIRFYESKGLIKSIGRKGLRRQYSRHVIQTILLIKILKNGGLSLREIEEIFLDNNKININRGLIDSKVIEIEEKVRNLKNLLQILQHVKSCPYKEHLLCPDFIKMIK